MKVFQKNLMASESVGSYLGSGVSTTIALNDGDCVEVGGLAGTDINVRTLTYGGATCNAVVDYVGVSNGNIQGVNYREGIKVFGLSAQTGEPVRYRTLAVGDTFWLADGNLVGTPVVGTSFVKPTVTGGSGDTATVADGTWTVSASKAASGLSLKVEGKKNLVAGSRNEATLYFCTVVQA